MGVSAMGPVPRVARALTGTFRMIFTNGYAVLGLVTAGRGVGAPEGFPDAGTGVATDPAPRGGSLTLV